MASRGVIFNFVVPSYSHDERAAKETIAAADGALAACAEALAANAVEERLLGPVIRPVFRRRN
jgi:hypothetical protein